MIEAEYGIHTFSLKSRCKYSEIQNIIEQNECICTNTDKYGLSRYYRITKYKAVGVEILLSQSLSRPCWLTLIVNPSSLLAGCYEPTALFRASDSLVQEVKHRLRGILDEIGVEIRLKMFKLSRCDLTCNRYYESRRDIAERLEIFRKSLLIPRYRVVSFGEYTKSDAITKAADKHSWTIENKSKSCAFSVYDKAYELRKRHDIAISKHILRLELRFGRAKLAKITRSKDWETQLVELCAQTEKQQKKFLHRLHMRCLTQPRLTSCSTVSTAPDTAKRQRKSCAALRKRRTAASRSQPSGKSAELRNLTLLNCWESSRRWGCAVWRRNRHFIGKTFNFLRILAFI